jgi:metallo-beta-lactamase class B
MAHAQHGTGSATRVRSTNRLAMIGVLRLGLSIAATFLFIHAAQAQEQPFQGCPSKEIATRFEEFSQTGKMPPDLGRWLHDPKAQYIEPWKVFDNVYFVGVCWVSAWAIRTSDGVVLIDTLHEPHMDQLVANLRKVGVNLAEIKYVLITHGHFDHAGGAFKLKPLLPNAKFVMTQTGWDEAMESAKASQGRRSRGR